MSSSTLDPQSIILRTTLKPGDIGNITARQGVLYNTPPYDFNIVFEAFIAQICAGYLINHDDTCERLWIAERPVPSPTPEATPTETINGVTPTIPTQNQQQKMEYLGCILLVCHPTTPKTAKLRILAVERAARGTGLGTRLVTECLKFARECGEYERVELRTAKVLRAAQRIYERVGFRLLGEVIEFSDGSGGTMKSGGPPKEGVPTVPALDYVLDL